MLEATGVKFEWESFAAGAEAFEKYHEYIPKELSESIERTRVGLKGPVTTPIGGGFSSINVELRKRFELFANFRPIRNLPHIPTRYPGIDLIVVRENTEGLYSGIEHEVVPGVVESIKVISEKASTRISRFAFEHARKNKRKKIHCIHKANIMKLSDGLFLRCARTISKEYPEITYGEHIVDNTCMQLVMNPTSTTCCCWKISTATLFPICAPGWWAGSALSRERISGTSAPFSKPYTALRRISPEKISPIPPPCCDLPC